ncbi:glycosyltransferase [Sunxiuqinia sp. A32]|uniref:glycosyltransferase n=1 Tax=Sunxiuqinia sp. A32 TaxID=3461496 RepID=UPI0040462A3E
MISAIISTYNRERFLNGLFESILNQSISKDDYEIVIVNNNSTDRTEQICWQFMADHPDVKCSYFVETKQGLSYGRNRGIEESNGDLVTFLDDDAIIAPDFFEKTNHFFDAYPTVNAMGGRILLRYMEEKPAWYNPFIAPILGYFNPGDKQKVFSNNYFRGSNMSFRKVVFEKHGGFDVRLGRKAASLYGNEEKELFYRFKENGEVMWYVPEAVVYHLVPIERTTDEFVRRQAIGIGKSERIRTLSLGKAKWYFSVFKELLKWAASFGIAAFYLVTFRYAASRIIVKFRAWVSKGLIFRYD